MQRLLWKILASALLVFCSSRASGQFVLDQPSLTLDAAVKMVNACEALAKSSGWKVSIWVVDENGVPVHTKHMQGAPGQAIQAAQMKAMTSKQWMSSSDPADAKAPIGKMTKDSKGQVMSVLLDSFPDGGGLPVIVDGKFAGAIGVGGIDGPLAAKCAQAGVNAIQKP